MKVHLLSRLLLPAAVLTLANCATKSAGPQAADGDDLDDYAAIDTVSDPLEPVNRAIFRFNDGLYNCVLRPIAKSYEWVTPKPVRTALDNGFENVKYPVRLTNSLLQGKFERAGLETEKFLVNSLAGFGGLVRQSDRVPRLADLPEEDSGQTLAVWGLGHGPYLVLPVLGPSSVREAVGYASDYMLNPVNWGMFQHRDTLRYIPPSTNTLRALPEQLRNYDTARKDAIDPYLSVRSTYLQNRDAAARE
jgi:phospholipid-binding lipoprotein MlaA